ncbi:uncharacterized protein LOC119549660 [Drosophila subpulchrella]|uniref:uncharacterized protein LOC119549660 n=1 Tax=Drosophila subpulchrella TaxID=1486046 RepID=UPI0018A18DCC|nr:uncharacterized protein LOC119549660 [Drosophila subpulchrella]
MPRTPYFDFFDPSDRESSHDSESDEEFMKYLFSEEMMRMINSDEVPSKSRKSKKSKKAKKKLKKSSKSHHSSLMSLNDENINEPLPTDTAVEFLPSCGSIIQPSHKKSSKPFESALMSIEETNINESLQTDSSDLLSSGAPILQPSPDNFEPMQIKSAEEPMPPPESSIVLRAQPLPTQNKAKQEPELRGSVAKPFLNLKWENDSNYLPKPPVESHMDLFDPDLPSSSHIWKNYERLKEGSVLPSNAEWPLSCMAGQEESKSPPSNAMEWKTSETSSSEAGEPQENSAAYGLFDWDENSKWFRDNSHLRVCNDLPFDFSRMSIGLEEERALDDWIKTEGLNNPYCDFDEFNMLLSLARDYPKNRDLLFKVLKPPPLPPRKPNVVRKRPRVAFKVKSRPVDAVEPQFGKRVLYEKVPKTLPKLDTPKATVVDSVEEKQLKSTPESFGSIPPKPRDESANQEWLQQCSEIIFHQLQRLIFDSAKPTSEGPGATGFGCTTATFLLEDFEDIVDKNTTEFRDPQSKGLASKWSQQYGIKSAEHLRRSLTLTPIPVRQEQCLQKIRILRRPTKAKSEPLHLSIEIKFCKLFCTLEMNTHLYLHSAAMRVDNAVYKSGIGVIEVRIGASQIGWIWANGTVMIMNGRSDEEFAEPLRNIVATATGQMNFKADPCSELLHLRLCSGGSFPWSVNLEEFSKVHTVCAQPFLREANFVYFVNKDLPGVSARLYQSGMFQVFAMTTGMADEMVKLLHLHSASYRKP